MHPTARRCVWGAVVLWVAGSALVGLAPTLYDLADGWLGGAVDIVVGFLQEALVPTGAALVGAAVVIQALRGTRPSSGAEATTESQVSPVTGAVPTAGPPSSTASVARTPTGAVPSVPLSGPVPAAPLSSGLVPTAGPVLEGTASAGPVLPGTGATRVVPERPGWVGRPRSRRTRA